MSLGLGVGFYKLGGKNFTGEEVGTPKAIKLDGTGDYVRASGSDVGNIIRSTDGWTIAAWIKHTSKPSAHALSGYMHNGNSYAYLGTILYNNPRAFLKWHSDSAITSISPSRVLSSSQKTAAGWPWNGVGAAPVDGSNFYFIALSITPGEESDVVGLHSGLPGVDTSVNTVTSTSQHDRHSANNSWAGFDFGAFGGGHYVGGYMHKLAIWNTNLSSDALDVLYASAKIEDSPDYRVSSGAYNNQENLKFYVNGENGVETNNGDPDSSISANFNGDAFLTDDFDSTQISL